MKIPQYTTIVQMLAARRCFNGGQSITRIAKSAGKHPSTIRRWLKTTGLQSTRRKER